MVAEKIAQERVLERFFPDLHPAFEEERAILEASRCLECGTENAIAPCVAACPTSIDIPQFIRQIRYGDFKGSAWTIFNRNVLGGSCGRVCPVEAMCEGQCVLRKEGRKPVEIGRLQRFATDYAINNKIMWFDKPVAQGLGHVAVVGAGPAGLSCAAELAKGGYAVTVFEKREFPGGLLTHVVAPYKQRLQPLLEEMKQIEQLGVEFRFRQEVGVDVSVESLESDFDAVFLGIGMGGDTVQEIPGLHLKGVYRSLEFIEQVKMGNPDAIPMGNHVAVIGGGNTAIDVAREVLAIDQAQQGGPADRYSRVDVARQALRLGARQATVIYRRTREQMPAYAHEVEEAEIEGVQFVWLTEPVELIGDGRVRQLKLRHMRLGEPDSSGRARPESVPGSEHVIDVDMVVFAIGQQPHRGLLEKIRGLEMKWSTVKVEAESCQTTHPQFFAGGDCINGGGTVVQAVADGKRAAAGIMNYLHSRRFVGSERGG